MSVKDEVNLQIILIFLTSFLISTLLAGISFHLSYELNKNTLAHTLLVYFGMYGGIIAGAINLFRLKQEHLASKVVIAVGYSIAAYFWLLMVALLVAAANGDGL